MNHLMIDLETLGTRFDAPVISIGAVWFDPATGAMGKTFYGAATMGDAFRYGKASGETVAWWLEQSDEARSALIKGTHTLERVMSAFEAFISEGPADFYPWSNGATFDISILEYAFPRVLGREAPWKFWNIRDCRTIKHLAQHTGVRETKLVGTAHNALDDAVHQAKWVSQMWQALRGKQLVAQAPASADDLLG